LSRGLGALGKIFNVIFMKKLLIMKNFKKVLKNLLKIFKKYKTFNFLKKSPECPPSKFFMPFMSISKFSLLKHFKIFISPKNVSEAKINAIKNGY
jgi:hypothetical protein